MSFRQLSAARKLAGGCARPELRKEAQAGGVNVKGVRFQMICEALKLEEVIKKRSKEVWGTWGH